MIKPITYTPEQLAHLERAAAWVSARVDAMDIHHPFAMLAYMVMHYEATRDNPPDSAAMMALQQEVRALRRQVAKLERLNDPAHWTRTRRRYGTPEERAAYNAGYAAGSMRHYNAAKRDQDA